MRIAFACPKCEKTTQREIAPPHPHLECSHCHNNVLAPDEAFDGERLHRCLVCGGGELFIRKDFSQSLGIALIVVAGVVSSIFWAYYMVYWALGTLFVGALVDLMLYNMVGNLLECYRCHAEYREMPGLDQYAPFSLEVHERYRQQAIRLREAQREQALQK